MIANPKNSELQGFEYMLVLDHVHPLAQKTHAFRAAQTSVSPTLGFSRLARYVDFCPKVFCPQIGQKTPTSGMRCSQCPQVLEPAASPCRFSPQMAVRAYGPNIADSTSMAISSSTVPTISGSVSIVTILGGITPHNSQVRNRC